MGENLFKCLNIVLEWYFLLKIHLHSIGLDLLGRSTKIQVWFPIIESISSLMASFQNEEPLDDFAFVKLLDTSSERKVVGCLFKLLLFPSLSTRQVIF